MQNTIIKVDNLSLAKDCTQFFCKNLRMFPEYISHSDVILGFAANETTWSDNLESHVEKEFTDIVLSASKEDVTKSVSEMYSIVDDCEEIIAFFMISFNKTYDNHLMILDDIVISPPLQRQGLGKKILSFLLDELVIQRQVTAFYLESGIKNHRAHCFFESFGFKPLSKVFMKRFDIATQSVKPQ